MYCTKQDMIDRFGELELIQRTDRNRTGVMDDTVLNQAISDATAEIDAYIVSYLPLSTVPTVLVRNCCDIARYFLFQEISDTDPIVKRYNAVISYLTQVAAGKITLGAVAGEVVQQTALAVMLNTSPKLFGRESR